ncbi:MAG: TetR family transcriptional regulator [Alphaproteobacteria bacterium]|nr:TetR family transcriptional regulator [Alphaproteobacteria bacterium]
MSTSLRAAEKPGYHHGDLRRALVAAAAKIVQREGAGAVTLREVARLAGVSHNAPYRHFDSLSALLAAVATEGFEEFGAKLRAAAEAEPDAKRRRNAIGRAYLRFALDNPRLYRLMFGAELDRREHAELRAAADNAFAVLTGTLSRTGRTGQADAINAWAFVHGLAHLVLDKQIKPNDPAVVDLLGK